MICCQSSINSMMRFAAFTCALSSALFGAFVHARQDGEPDQSKPVPPQSQMVMKFQFMPSFALHFDIRPSAAGEIAQSLQMIGSETEISAILREGFDKLQALQNDAKKRLAETGEDEGNQLLSSWHETYKHVTRSSDPEAYEKKVRAKAEMDAALEEIRKDIGQEAKRILHDAELILQSTALQVAAISPLDEEVSANRAKLILLRRSLFLAPDGAYYGDFQRPIDLRDFIRFASSCDKELAALFGLLENPRDFAQPENPISEILQEHDDAQLLYLMERLSKRREMYAADGVVASRDSGRAWTRAFEIPKTAVDRIALVIEESSPKLASSWRSLFEQYLCPELTGIWPADQIIAEVRAVQRTLPEELLAAFDSIADQYEIQRDLLQDQAISAGVAAAKKYGSPGSGRIGETDRERQIYADKISSLKQLDARTIQSVKTLFEGVESLESLRSRLERVLEEIDSEGNRAIVRPQVAKFLGVRVH